MSSRRKGSGVPIRGRERNRGFDSLDILIGATKELSGRPSRYAEFARARGNS